MTNDRHGNCCVSIKVIHFVCMDHINIVFKYDFIVCNHHKVRFYFYNNFHGNFCRI